MMAVGSVARSRSYLNKTGNEMVLCAFHNNESVTMMYFTKERGIDGWVWQYNTKEMHGDTEGVGSPSKLYTKELKYVKEWLSSHGFKSHVLKGMMFAEMEGSAVYHNFTNLQDYPNGD